MFKSVKLPANRGKKFIKLLKFREEIPDPIAKNELNAMVAEGKPLEGSKLDDRIWNIYVENAHSNRTGLHDFSPALATAKPSSSAISNSKFTQMMSPLKQFQFHPPGKTSHKIPPQQTHLKGGTVFAVHWD